MKLAPGDKVQDCEADIWEVIPSGDLVMLHADGRPSGTVRTRAEVEAEYGPLMLPGTRTPIITVEQARVVLETDGWTVLRTKSYLAAQHRQQVAQARLDCAERDRDNAYTWALGCLDRERHLADRCTFLYGAAIEAGARGSDLIGVQSGDWETVCTLCGLKPTDGLAVRHRVTVPSGDTGEDADVVCMHRCGHGVGYRIPACTACNPPDPTQEPF